MKFFVSADIHGFYDEWQLALNERKREKKKILRCKQAKNGSQS